jgi:hypothetical protein
MLDVELVRDRVSKSAVMVLRQKLCVEELRARGHDTTEAEHLLACFATAYTFFKERLARALIEETTLR